MGGFYSLLCLSHGGTSRLEKPLTIYVRDSTVYCNFHMEGTSRVEKPLTIPVRDSTVYCAFHMEGTSRVEKPLTIHVRDSTVYCAFHMEVPQGWKSHSQNRKPVLKDHVYCTIYICSLLNVRIHLA